MDLLRTLSAADEALLRASRGSPAWAVHLFVVITFVGGGFGMLALVPFLARPRTRAKMTWLVLAIVTTSAVVGLLKALFGRVRPCDALAACEAVFVSSPGGPSFPSGHAAGAFTFAAFVALAWPRFAAPALVFAALVAWSRCFLGVHYPSDILAGALLGSALGARFAMAAAHGGSPFTRFQLKRLRLKPLELKDSSRNESRSRASSPPGPGDT